MASPLPPDPYVALGVSKTATLAEIRSAHRKLVIKCHPDKVQDPALKAVKQEEFHKVQQAYELLSDDTKRTGYDEQIKLMELRKEMGRNGSAPGPSPGKTTVFDYEVRETAPRPSTFAKSSKFRPEPSKVYTQPQPRSYEDDLPSRTYDEPMRARSSRKTTAYDEAPRRSTREEEKRRRAEEDKLRERAEKAEKEARKSARGSDKKSRDKERRKGSEEKHTTRTTATHVTDSSSDDHYHASKSERKSSRRAVDEEAIRQREKEAARAAEKAAAEKQILTDRTRKMDRDKEFAAQYMSASRRKAAPVEKEEDFRPKPMRRAETFQETYSAPRYAPAQAAYPTVEEDSEEESDHVRRSSARAPPRRASEQVPTTSRTTREPSRPAASTRKPSTYDAGKPYIVDATPPAASAAMPRKPPMPSHTSAPATLHNMVPPPPGRSRTMPTAYAPPPPPLGRAQTFQSGDKARSSNSRKPADYDSEDSESSDGRSPSPPRRQPEPTRYIIKERGAVPVTSHRTALREDDYSYARERSQSPRGGSTRRTAERPPLARSSGSSKPPSSRSQNYYTASSTEPPGKTPIIKEARPKMAPRESTTSTRGHGAYFEQVKYTPTYGPEHVSYTGENYRRGPEPYAYPAPRREATYA